MKGWITLAAALLTGSTLQAQYYYRDLLSVQQSNAEQRLLKQLGIRSVKVHSFEADGTPSTGFRCEKTFSRDYRSMETVTESPGTSASVQQSEYNQQGWLVRSSDSSEITAASTLYAYDSAGRIARIISYTHSSDDDFSTALREVHEYRYSPAGAPLSMLKIRNDRDTVRVDFATDAKGWVTDEWERSPQGRHYYYYYNDSGRLTDIVRYNPLKSALAPDFIFEYNSRGQLVQMVTVEEGMPGNFYKEKEAARYTTWQYFYDDDGLRIIEKCFAGRNSLLGYVEYEYD